MRLDLRRQSLAEMDDRRDQNYEGLPGAHGSLLSRPGNQRFDQTWNAKLRNFDLFLCDWTGWY